MLTANERVSIEPIEEPVKRPGFQGENRDEVGFVAVILTFLTPPPLGDIMASIDCATCRLVFCMAALLSLEGTPTGLPISRICHSPKKFAEMCSCCHVVGDDVLCL